MLIPTIIMGVIAIALLYIGYQRGGGEHVVGLKSAGKLLLEITPLQVGGRRIRLSWSPDWFCYRWSHARWALRQYADRRRTVTYRGKHRHHGSLNHGMVVAGIQSAAYRNRLTGLEIHLNPPGVCLFLSPDFRTNRQ